MSEQRRDAMNVGRLVIAGIVASILLLVLDAALGMLGGLIGTRLFGLPSTQPEGIESKMVAGLIFELVNGFMLAVVYAIIHNCLPSVGWVKGLSYGLLVWGLRVVMWAFSTYMMTDMSPITISITVATGLVEMLIIGGVIAVLYR
jgi:hypothetical protein